jgi:hypothetical protein
MFRGDCGGLDVWGWRRGDVIIKKGVDLLGDDPHAPRIFTDEETAMRIRDSTKVIVIDRLKKLRLNKRTPCYVADRDMFRLARLAEPLPWCHRRLE